MPNTAPVTSPRLTSLSDPNETKISCLNDTTIQIDQTGKPQSIFTFDHVFYDQQRPTQRNVYDLAAKTAVMEVLRGYNGTIFAYGQTGSGKSYSMFGPDMTEAGRGIIPRACSDIFDYIAKDTDGIEFTVKCGFLEIYKEVVRDLLTPKGGSLKVREAPSRGVWVEGLSEVYVTSEQEILDLIKLGESHRSIAATNMNETSSRSHSLFTITILQRWPDGTTKSGKLNLADLAGSEKVNKTGATGDTLEEAKKINQSLSALGNCIMALTKSRRGHIPYRDSKLTHILRESLGGNSKTTLLITCSPDLSNVDETVSTLLFGKRAKSIKNRVELNIQRSTADLNRLIQHLTEELDHQRLLVKLLEEELIRMKGETWDLNQWKKAALGQFRYAQKQQNLLQQLAEETEAANSSPDDDGDVSSASDTDLSMSVDITSSPATPTRSGLMDSQATSPVTTLVGSEHLIVIQLRIELEKLREASAAAIRELKEDLRTMVETKETKTDELSDLKRKVDDRTIEVIKAEGSIDGLKLQVNKWEYQAKQKSKELHVANLKIAVLQERTVALERRLAEGNTETPHKISVSEADRELENETLKMKLQEHEQTAQITAAQLSDAAGRVEHLEDELSITYAQVEELKKLVKTHDQEKERLRLEHEREISVLKEAASPKVVRAPSQVITPSPTRQTTVVRAVTSRLSSLRKSMTFGGPVATVARSVPSQKEGWLTKEGGFFKNWKRRWFVVKNGTVQYFTDDKCLVLKGEIKLTPLHVVYDAIDFTKRNNSFGIFDSENKLRTFFMQAESSQVAKEWIEFLTATVTSLDHDTNNNANTSN